ncbi:MAG: hypothetical protein J6S85_18180 [Methanobrevibacter sp.]|nr:hypothetical protein [Methanobrevibacter sp.]
MKDMKELLAGTGATILSATGTALQTEEVLRIVSLIITILGAIISMIVLPLLTWYKNAKRDGKITKDEIKEGIDTLQEGIEGVKDALDDKKGDKN